jgi:carbonic anhydrase
LIDKLLNLSQKLAEERKKDPELVALMDIAAQGQAPRYLIVSQIHRSSQDLQLLNMQMGDAFQATRVSGQSLPHPDFAPTLFKGPASYNRCFHRKKGIIVTFEQHESSMVIRETLDNLTLHPNLDELPIIALRIKYESGRASLVAHGKGRDYEEENRILSRIQRPDRLDDDVLVLICSDSRIHPPHTENGVPMAIQTLAGYLPKLTGRDDETQQLNSFFEEWLSSSNREREILIVAHGNFEGEGPSCGAATISLNPSQAPNNTLLPILEDLQYAAQQFESEAPDTPEDRVKSLCLATRENLMTYPAISAASQNGLISIDELFMDTVSNVLYQDDSLRS